MYYKLMILTSLAVSISACDNSSWLKKDKSIAAESTFQLDSIEAEVITTKSDPTFAIAQAKEYKYTVCLTDLINDGNIRKKDFKIYDAANVIAAVQSDSEGCMSWSESYTLNSLQASNDLAVSRKIVSQSINGSELDLEFMINPWKHGAEDQYLTAISSEVQLSPAEFNNRLVVKDHRPQPLWVDKVKLKFQPDLFDTKTLAMPFRLSFHPKVLVLGKEGSLEPFNLTKGQFELDLMLIYKYLAIDDDGNMDLKKVRITKPAPIAIENIEQLIKKDSEEEFLEVVLPFHIFPSNGEISLGMTLKPVNGPDNLTLFEGHFPIGEIQGIHSYQELTVSQDVIKRADDEYRFEMNYHLSTDQDQELENLKTWLAR